MKQIPIMERRPSAVTHPEPPGEPKRWRIDKSARGKLVLASGGVLQSAGVGNTAKLFLDECKIPFERRIQQLRPVSLWMRELGPTGWKEQNGSAKNRAVFLRQTDALSLGGPIRQSRQFIVGDFTSPQRSLACSRFEDRSARAFQHIRIIIDK